MDTYDLYLAFGKSVKNTAVFATTYGKPGNQKVTWSYEVKQVTSNGSTSYLTNTFTNEKLISVSTSGVLSVAFAVTVTISLEPLLQ